MIEKQGGAWNSGAEVICVTTNCITTYDGKAVMGAGMALQAAYLYPELPEILGNHIKRQNSDILVYLPADKDQLIICFPTKYHWRDSSDIDLILKSCEQLVEVTQRMKFKRVALVRPGCGYGQLKWPYVKSKIEPILKEDIYEIWWGAKP